MSQAAPLRPPRRRPGWLVAGAAGLGFGLAYGITERLLQFNVGELIRFGQGFDVQVFPGTSLDSLRLRFGETESALQGELGLQQLESQPAPDRPKLEPRAASTVEARLAEPAEPADPAAELQDPLPDPAAQTPEPLPPEPATRPVTP